MNADLEIYIEYYKRKLFHKIPVFQDEQGNLYYLSKAQLKALEYLHDNTTLFVGYGGSGMSGKTQLECFYVLFQCLSYSDVRYMIGRSELKNLKATTIQTLLRTFKFYGLERDIDYKYNDQQSFYEFNNISRVVCRDTKYYPSDPEMTDIGGLDLTGAVIDESAENREKVFIILTSRVGRWNNQKYGIPAKILEGFNPLKGNVYNRYWKPFRDKIEPLHRKFVRALSSDNPNPEAREWEKKIILSGDKRTIQRLLHGNFDYDDDDNALCNFDKINDIFTNDYVGRNDKGEIMPELQNYLSCDIAISNDHFVSIAWKGLRIIEIERVKNISPTQITTDKENGIANNKIDFTPLMDVLKKQALKYQVPRSNIVYDASGIGNHLVKLFPGAVAVHSGVVVDKEYNNLKSKLEFKLAQSINAGLIYCNPDIDSITKEVLIDELQMLKIASESGEKMATIKTALIKELLGWSPDIMKAASYRMLFLITRGK